MRRSTRRMVEDWLRDYPHITEYIHQREQELKYPVREDDDNIGGGKGNKISRPEEQYVLTKDQDARLSALEKQQKAIDDALDYVEDGLQTVIAEYYFVDHPKQNLLALGAKEGYAQHGLYSKLNSFYADILKNLGLGWMA